MVIPKDSWPAAEQRLKELGIQLPSAPTPFGRYVETVQTGNLLFLSGMLPVVDGKPKFIGRLGKELDSEGGRDAAYIAALNVLASLVRPATDHELSGWLFVKGLALVYIAAFASLAVQIDSLAGPDGILPFQRVLDGAFAEHGWWALLRLPTLFWLASSAGALRAAAIAGALVALLLAFGWVGARPALVVRPV